MAIITACTGGCMNKMLLALLALCAATIFFPHCSIAQMTAAFDRSQPPALTVKEEFLFPEYARTTLSNGVPLILVEDHAQPLLSVHIVLRRGAADERIPGLANFMAQMLTRGTTSRSAQQIADEMDFLGGSLSASASWDTTTISMTLLTKFATAGLNVFADVVKNATFPQDEVERYKQQTLSYLQQNYVEPAYLASVGLRTALYGNHTYSHAMSGTMESIRSIEQRDCIEFYQRAVAPSNAFIIATGNVTLDQLKGMLETALQGWEGTATEREPAVAPAPLEGKPQIVVVPKSDAAQTMLLVGFFAPSISDPDYPAMQFLNTLFGAFFVSRLNANLREEKGYTYGVSSSIDVRAQAAALIIGTSVGKDVTLPAVQEILHELHRMATEPISDEELALTKKYILGSFALRTATPNQVVGLLSSLEIHGLPDEYYEQYYRTLAGITKEQLFDVQQRRFSPSSIVIAASGEVEYLQSILKDLGEVSLVDAEGKKLDAK